MYFTYKRSVKNASDKKSDVLGVLRICVFLKQIYSVDAVSFIVDPFTGWNSPARIASSDILSSSEMTDSEDAL